MNAPEKIFPSVDAKTGKHIFTQEKQAVFIERIRYLLEKKG